MMETSRKFRTILGNSINRYLKEAENNGVGWIILAQDEDQWWDLPLEVMKIPVPKTGLIYLLTYSMEQSPS
jgi:hypothetical protein